jgi:hypothetical protein
LSILKKIFLQKISRVLSLGSKTRDPCYGLNVTSSQNSYAEILTPKAKVLGDGDFQEMISGLRK